MTNDVFRCFSCTHFVDFECELAVCKHEKKKKLHLKSHRLENDKDEADEFDNTEVEKEDQFVQPG